MLELGKKYDDAWYHFLQVKVGPAALVVTNVTGDFRDGQGDVTALSLGGYGW